jgi:hypothetical protein
VGFHLTATIRAVEKFSPNLESEDKRFYNMNTWKIKFIQDYAAAIVTIRNLEEHTT